MRSNHRLSRVSSVRGPGTACAARPRFRVQYNQYNFCMRPRRLLRSLFPGPSRLLNLDVPRLTPNQSSADPSEPSNKVNLVYSTSPAPLFPLLLNPFPIPASAPPLTTTPPDHTPRSSALRLLVPPETSRSYQTRRDSPSRAALTQPGTCMPPQRTSRRTAQSAYKVSTKHTTTAIV